MKLVFVFSVVFVAGVCGQRFLPATSVQAKSVWCFNILGFDYVSYIQQIDGITYIDRGYFKRIMSDGTARIMMCAPGTWFDITSGCICGTTVPDPDTFNLDRCVVINGNLQSRVSLIKTQRGSVNTRPVKTEGHDGLALTSQCFAGNSTNFMTIPFFNGNSLARTDLSIRVGFSIIPSTPVQNNDGRAYRLVQVGGCTGDTNAALAFSVTYTAGSLNLGVTVAPSLEVMVQLVNENVQQQTERTLRLTCTINDFTFSPQGVQLRDFIWNEADATNYFQFLLNQTTGSIALGLFNGFMDNLSSLNAGNVPANGFCQNFQTNNIVALQSGSIIARRDCDMYVGLGSGAFPVCMRQFTMTRDCTDSSNVGGIGGG